MSNITGIGIPLDFSSLRLSNHNQGAGTEYVNGFIFITINLIINKVFGKISHSKCVHTH